MRSRNVLNRLQMSARLLTVRYGELSFWHVVDAGVFPFSCIDAPIFYIAAIESCSRARVARHNEPY